MTIEVTVQKSSLTCTELGTCRVLGWSGTGELDVEELIDSRQLAKLMRVTPETIRAWVRRRWIPCLRAGRRGEILFRLASVEAALEKRAREVSND